MKFSAGGSRGDAGQGWALAGEADGTGTAADPELENTSPIAEATRIRRLRRHGVHDVKTAASRFLASKVPAKSDR